MKAEIVGLMKSITQLGRSSGIHMVLAPLRLSTLIPTTRGYKTMKTIEVGDVIFDKYNKPTKVTAVAPIKMSEEMYEININGCNNFNNEISMSIGSDGEHRFPIIIKTADDKINYSLELKNIFNNLNLSININGETLATTKQIYELLNGIINIHQRYFIYIRSANNYNWLVEDIVKIPNELVRCIEVESDSHLFLVTNIKAEEWNGCGENNENGYLYPQLCVLTHNTQRNDASIIPGVIQNNSLSLDTQLRIRRKINDSNL